VFSIPYDNIHKFIAIAGLALAVGSAGFGYTTYSNRIQEVERLFDELRPLKEEIELIELSRQREHPSGGLKYEEGKCEREHPNDEKAVTLCLATESQKILDYIDSINARVKASREQFDRLQILIVKTDGITERLDQGVLLFRVRMILSASGLIAGGIAFIIGFLGWLKQERGLS
jgi:hypothetical protein